jgi:hypothetical protein
VTVVVAIVSEALEATEGRDVAVVEVPEHAAIANTTDEARAKRVRRLRGTTKGYALGRWL